MCGIVGLVRASEDAGSIEATRAVLGRMCDSLAHRGPDSMGLYADEAAGLGHARLSIIDIEGGRQPLANEDGQVQAVCNGEIYNYRELREELRGRGHRFRSESDSETLVHLYEEVGEKLPERLNGMFALAIWDRRERRLLLARDRMGQKPLYYSTDEPGFRIVFASELKALDAEASGTREIDPKSVAGYLAHGYVPDPRTIYRGVHKLAPGCCLSVTAAGVRMWRYWRPRFEVSETTADRAAEELEALLGDSVRLRMMADVPIGAFLSGGVDSSATAGLMAERAPGRICTFSIGFPEAAYDESPHARSFAERIGSRHVEDVLEGPTPALLERFAETYDEPFGDSSALPTLRVSELARGEVTVALSGDGADEVFGGYERYSRELLKGLLRGAIPGAVLPLLRRAGGGGGGLAGASRAGRVRAGFADLGGGVADSYFCAMAAFHEDDLRGLLAAPVHRELGGWTPREAFRERFEETAGLPLLSRLQACDFETYLPGDILTKVDRASMAHSLEVRSPWLDHRIVEFACRLPPGLKAGVRFRKKIVRRMLRGRVPEALLQRRKRGFAIPAGRWLRHDLRTLFEWAISRPEMEELIRRDEARRLWARYHGGEGRAATQLWHLFALALWACRHRGREAVDWDRIRRPAAA